MSNPLTPGPESTVVDLEKRAFREGFRACAPPMLGIGAWGLVTGMAMVKSGLTIWQAFGMTFLVFAGSAQLAALPLMAANVPVWVVFLTAMVVNLRFVIFAAALAPHFAHLPWYRRIWHGYFNGDMLVGFFHQRFPPGSAASNSSKIGFYNGLAYTNWGAWQIGSVAGILLASLIPPEWGIAFAGTLALLAITIPMTVNLAALVGVAAASVVAIALVDLPYRLGLLVAVIAGMLAAMLADTWLERKKEEQ